MVDEIKKRSVTAADIGDVHRAPVFLWMLNSSFTQPGTGLPVWWSPARDWYLRQTVEQESFWASALGVAITKMSSQAWEVESDAPRVRNYFQELLLAADNNQSWVSFLSKHLLDFLCTDNGAFIEIVRATNAAGSRILGLMHLDSVRCTRTGDPEIPVIYRDTKDAEHEMKAHQVIAMSDMPDPSETWYGVGHCAASRAYRGILKLASIENYIYDKVSGQRPKAAYVVSGISNGQIESAIQMAKEQRESESQFGRAFTYMGAVIIPTLSDTPINLATIPFAELPDGFDRQQEFNISMLQYANAIGLDPQDLQPLTGAALGTGTQATVLAEKGKGKGLAAWRQQFTHNLNQFILPDTVEFAFSEQDLRDEQAQANVNSTIAATVQGMIASGVITPAQGAQILADAKVIPDEFVPVDQTPGGTLEDTEKPESEPDRQEAQQQQEEQANANQPPQEEEQPAEKSVTSLSAGYRAELTRLVKQTQAGELTASDMAQRHTTLIKTLAPAAFAEGLKAGGVDESELDDDDQRTIDDWISGQLPYVDGFAQAAATKETSEKGWVTLGGRHVFIANDGDEVDPKTFEENTKPAKKLKYGSEVVVLRDGKVVRGTVTAQAEKPGEFIVTDSHDKKHTVKKDEMRQPVNAYNPREKATLDDRIGFWTRALETVGNLGRMSAQRNAMGTWKLALPIEDHCDTCMNLYNVRHRLKWFTSKGYIPREPGSATLACKGFKCGCKIIDDNGRQLL